MSFPTTRPRRLRQNEGIRQMIAETRLAREDFVYPLFVKEEDGPPAPVNSMPGVFQYGIRDIGAAAREAQELGIPAIILFGIPLKKDALGSSAFDPKGVIQTAITEIREKAPSMTVIADCCLCEYTDHGHCGPVKNGQPDNDRTLEILSKTAVSQAMAGAHIIAPSGMMDGMVGAIRKALDTNSSEDTLILSYSAKYASAFYGPFREAAGSGDSFRGDRKGHQMDPRNGREALTEVKLDLEEGADMIMVKPALAYLDVISLIKQNFNAPLAAYNVSGEYAMIKAAGKNGWCDEKKVAIEVLTSIKRAGADIIISYFAKDVVKDI